VVGFGVRGTCVGDAVGDVVGLKDGALFGGTASVELQTRSLSNPHPEPLVQEFSSSSFLQSLILTPKPSQIVLACENVFDA